MRRWLKPPVLALTLAMLPASRCLAHDFRAKVTVRRTAAGDKGDKAEGNANVVVWLTPVGGSPAPLPVVHPRLAQKNKRFEPHLLVIPAGTVVEFPNQDPFFHNVFSLYKGKRFDLGLYEAGSSRSVRFDRPGVSFIFCNIHPEMSAVVVALETPYYAISNNAGEVRIRDVPEGRYRLEVWYERSSPEALSRLARQISIPAEGPVLSLQVPEVLAANVPHKNKYGQDYDKSTGYKPQ
jgi:plastocyanin